MIFGCGDLWIFGFVDLWIYDFCEFWVGGYNQDFGIVEVNCDFWDQWGNQCHSTQINRTSRNSMISNGNIKEPYRNQ